MVLILEKNHSVQFLKAEADFSEYLAFHSIFSQKSIVTAIRDAQDFRQGTDPRAPRMRRRK